MLNGTNIVGQFSFRHGHTLCGEKYRPGLDGLCVEWKVSCAGGERWVPLGESWVWWTRNWVVPRALIEFSPRSQTTDHYTMIWVGGKEGGDKWRSFWRGVGVGSGGYLFVSFVSHTDHNHRTSDVDPIGERWIILMVPVVSPIVC